MNTIFSSFVLLTLSGIVLCQQEVEQEHVPEVVYPTKTNRMRRIHSHSAEQTSKPSGGRSAALENDHHDLLQKRLEHIKANRRVRDHFIVIAPVDGHRVYTMDRYFVSPNGLQKVPSSLIQHLPIKVESEKLGKSSVREVKQQSSVQKDKFLKLVTVEPPLSYARSHDSHGERIRNDHNITQGVRISGQTDKITSSVSRFPAQPWQIPPNINSKFSNTRPSVSTESVEKSFEALNAHKRPIPLPRDQGLVRTSASATSRSAEYIPENQTIRPPYRPNAKFLSSPQGRRESKLKATFAKTDARKPIPLPGQSQAQSDSQSDYGRAADDDHDLFSRNQNSNSQNSIDPIVPINRNERPTSSLLNPNQKLDLCCRKQGVSPLCQTMCNFDTFSDKTLVNAFLTNQCPGPQLGQAFDCATTKVDHSECCIRKNVHVFNNGQCLPFCRTHVPTPPNAFEYLACLQVFESIKGCYREYQFTNSNLFGD